METSTKYIIASAATVAIAIGAVTFAVVSSEPAVPERNTSTPIVKTNYQLTEDDKSEIKLVTDSLIGVAGTYGWAPEILTNPVNLSLAKTDVGVYPVFDQLTHSTPNDAVAQLNRLSDSNRYGSSVNRPIFDIPFSVKTELTGDLTYPEEVFEINGYPTVEVTAPIRTTLTYVAEDYNYVDDAGNLNIGGIHIETLVFEDNVSATLALQSSGWILDNFNQNTGVFITDETFSFPNGQFESLVDTPIVSYTVQQVNDDGTLAEPEDNLERYNAIMDGTYVPETTDELGGVN
jgi:hypothetical protein